MLASAESSVAVVLPNPPVTPSDMDTALLTGLRLLARGVRLRVLLPRMTPHSTPATILYTQWLGQLGGEVRTTASLPGHLLLVDDRLVALPEQDDLGWVEHGAVVRAVTLLFEQCWELAVPVGHDGTPAPDQPDGQLRPLLQLLAKGLTEEAVANRLGVSRSTIQRGIARLMKQLGARSRFEAGHLAAIRGWI
ncbi:LuxR family transcriptional regulator [Pseudonocardiaceae bacterium YIM PH 21723]|nr:LuxR family transcriptional regulator [Pseudonocardiaceae bacterium YIM PH 21723]